MRCNLWHLHRDAPADADYVVYVERADGSWVKRYLCAVHADEYGEQAIKDGALRVNCYPRLRGAA